MCKAVSIIMSADQVWYPSFKVWDHSHTSIAKANGLADGLIGDKLARVEITPKDDNYQADPSMWIVKLDEEREPGWWADDRPAQLERALAYAKRYMEQVEPSIVPGYTATGGDRSTLTGGDRSTLTGGNGSTLTGGDRSTLTGGNGSTLTGGNDSTLTGGYDSTLTGGDRSTLTGGNGSTLTGGYDSTLTGGDRSTLTGGYDSTLTGGYGSTLTGGYDSTLTGGYGSTLTGGDRSTLTGGYDSTLTGGNDSVFRTGDRGAVMGMELDADFNFIGWVFGAVGVHIKANVWYEAKGGKLVEVPETDERIVRHNENMKRVAELTAKTTV